MHLCANAPPRNPHVTSKLLSDFENTAGWHRGNAAVAGSEDQPSICQRLRIDILLCLLGQEFSARISARIDCGHEFQGHISSRVDGLEVKWVCIEAVDRTDHEGTELKSDLRSLVPNLNLIPIRIGDVDER